MTHNATSYSDLNSYGRCAAQYYFRKVVRIQRKRKNKNLKQGTMIHDGLKDFFLALREGMEYQDAKLQMWSNFDATMETLWEDNPELFEDELKELEQLYDDSLRIVLSYIDVNAAEIENWEILHVEEEFVATLASGEIITFTPDLIIRDKHGFVWIIDHKSTSKMPTVGVPFSDLQTLLYYAGIKSLYPELRGFRFNYLRKKVPTEPRMNKTHTKESKAYGFHFVNNVKAIDTTYEILRDFILENEPTLMGEPTHQQRLAELRDHDRFFFSEELLVSDDQVDAVLEDVDDTLRMMAFSRENALYPRTILGDLAGVQSCTNCEFNRICHTQLLGWNTDMVIEEEYEPRDPKNEYESEEDDDE